MPKYHKLHNTVTDEGSFLSFDDDQQQQQQQHQHQHQHQRNYYNDDRYHGFTENNPGFHNDNHDDDNDDNDNSRSNSNNNSNSSHNGSIVEINSRTTKTTTTHTSDFNDDTMEVPLMHHTNNNNSHNNEHGFEGVCLCQQVGFGTDPMSKSTQVAKSKIVWAITLCCIFMIVEFLGGYVAGSLAIMTDAAHLASDCISFVIGLVAIWLGSRLPDTRMSFGYKRMELLGAVVSILGIWILTATLVLMAIQRIYLNDYHLDANAMMAISGIGILINIVMLFILHTSTPFLPMGGTCRAHGPTHSHSHLHLPSYSDSQAAESTGTLLSTDTEVELSTAAAVRTNGLGFKYQHYGKRDKNVNLRAAMIHVIGDLVQSFGVFVASVLIKIYPTAVFLDPICTLLFSVIVIMTTVDLFKESINILVDAVPVGISMDDLEIDLANIEGVRSVHHLNVWNHISNHSILMVHLVIDLLADSNTVLRQATELAQSSKFNIKHSTIQIERMTA